MMQVQILAMLSLTLAAFGGCGQKVNPISSNISYGPDDQFANRTLDSAERAEVLKIMRDAVVGPTNAAPSPAESLPMN